MFKWEMVSLRGMLRADLTVMEKNILAGLRFARRRKTKWEMAEARANVQDSFCNIFYYGDCTFHHKDKPPRY